MLHVVRESVAWVLGYREVPFAVRGNFRRELFYMAVWGVVWGGLNGQFWSYVALRKFEAAPLLVSAMHAAMASAFLFSFWWTALARRVGKRRVIYFFQLATLVILFSFLLTPLADRITGEQTPDWLCRWTSPKWPLTALLFALQIILAWVMIQGTNTIRTMIWKVNYPDNYRGRILGRFTIWQILSGAIWVALIGAYLDGTGDLWGLTIDLRWLGGAGGAHAYALILPLTGVIGLLGAWLYRRVRVRDEKWPIDQSPDDRLGTESLEPTFNLPGWFAVRWGVISTGWRDSLHTLQKDRLFREYLSWLFIGGSGVLLVDPVFVLILKKVFSISYLQAAGVITFIPQLFLLLASPLWAKLFDRWPIFYFRGIQVGVWTLCRIMLTIAVVSESMTLVIVAMAIKGIAESGGRYAWDIGHMSFSNSANDSIYLGIHQTLTGIRGLLMPFIGVLLYQIPWIGWRVIPLSALMLAISTYGYWRLYLTTEKKPTPA
ncbi:MAG: hypothetical protein HJJLKODD_02323 [Phycisphaerae bacterium]|nr:hypothetical protein [Phycisphaerae bacterium]